MYVTSVDTVEYVDVLKSYKSLTKLVETPITSFKIISDENILRAIHSKVSEDSTYDIINFDKTSSLKLFSSVFPLKVDRLEYIKLLTIDNNDVTSTVWCKQVIDCIVINNFYRYIDIWNLIPTKGGMDNGPDDTKNTVS
jgi:hypothetical protein